jgi:hypothetical protein
VYWYCKAHLWAKGRTDNGQLCLADLSDWRKDLGDKVRRISSFAYPLSRLVGEHELGDLVVERLKREIESSPQTS